MTDTEFASAPYVLHQHQMALIRAAEAIGGLEVDIKALEKRVAKLEAAFMRISAASGSWTVPQECPPAPATDTDPAA